MKIVIAGAGFVGATVAYSILQRGAAEELVLVDADPARAEGEAMDLLHAAPWHKPCLVRSAALEHAGPCDLVVICAGRASVPGETRLDLLRDNVGRIRAICRVVGTWRPEPVVIVVSNPVDVLTLAAARELGGKSRVFGTGTSLDTARLRTLVGLELRVDPRSVHGYILGEHGDSEFAAWSTATAGGIPVRAWAAQDRLDALFERVRTAAYEIIKRKRATYYAIGATTAVVCEAVARDQRSILPVSVPLTGQYGLSDVALSLPCVLGREGVARVLEPALEPSERAALARSAEALKRAALPIF